MGGRGEERRGEEVGNWRYGTGFKENLEGEGEGDKGGGPPDTIVVAPAPAPAPGMMLLLLLLLPPMVLLLGGRWSSGLPFPVAGSLGRVTRSRSPSSPSPVSLSSELYPVDATTYDRSPISYSPHKTE